MLDLNERKKTEEKIFQSEQNLRKAQEVAKLGSWTWNSETDYFELSDAISKLLGLSETGKDLSFDEVNHWFTRTIRTILSTLSIPPVRAW